MKTLSVWRATAAEQNWPSLDADVETDVVIVGGGITGVTLALLLADEGRRVVLLEADAIGAGSTGNSTGNLYETLSEGIASIDAAWGSSVCRNLARSRREAMAFIEGQVPRLDANCGWRRCSVYRFALQAQAQEQIEKERRSSELAGLPVRVEDGLPEGLPKPAGPVLVLDDQAQFHPLAYVRAQARRAADAGCRIHERSAATAIDYERRTVRTARASVQAREIVLATHSPSGFHPVQAEMLPKQECALAYRGTSVLPPGIFWGIGSPMLSLRGLETDEGDFLICVGESHKTGHHDPKQAMADLESLAQQRLQVEAPIYRWSAQNFVGADGLPYIGRDASGACIATGYGTNGLTYGTLAAMMLRDEILGRDNPWKALYKPSRFVPMKAAAGVVAENLSVAKALVKDYLIDRHAPALTALEPGTGGLVEVDGQTLAAYRDATGELQLLSPVCTHMKCRVRWNALETSWDCPCHGSRFAPDGRVIEGPALQPLAARPLTPE